MKKKKIPAQPIKALFSREGLCIPQCWVAEKAQAEKDKALARARRKEEKGEEGGFGLSLFGKKKAAAVAADKKQRGKAAEEVGIDDSDEAGETDTELESDDDEDAAAEEPAGAQEGEDPDFKYQPLSKYEVFSFMRRVHDRSSSRVVEGEDAVEDMERAEKMVGVLYEQLPAQTLKQMSQQNRIKANLWQDSLVYGETEVPEFLEVIIESFYVDCAMISIASTVQLGTETFISKAAFGAATPRISGESCHRLWCPNLILRKIIRVFFSWINEPSLPLQIRCHAKEEFNAQPSLLGILHQVLVKLKRIHGHMMSTGGSFWDLGAGSGKLVIAAAMMHNFEVGFNPRKLHTRNINRVHVFPHARHADISSVVPSVLL